jgi:hypothetical protein
LSKIIQFPPNLKRYYDIGEGLKKVAQCETTNSNYITIVRGMKHS